MQGKMLHAVRLHLVCLKSSPKSPGSFQTVKCELRKPVGLAPRASDSFMLFRYVPFAQCGGVAVIYLCVSALKKKNSITVLSNT